MNKFKLTRKFNDGDKIYSTDNTILIKFRNKRNGIITSLVNGGYSEDFQAVFNHQLSQKNIDENESGEVDINVYLNRLTKNLADEFNLNEENISGLITSAKMKNAGIAVERFRKLEVVAISTAGTNVNAVAAGDPAGYYEENGEFDLEIGTINTIILINARLNESCLLQAEMTATEAKTVALRELIVPSRYSSKVATGTGTDGIAIFSEPNSENHLSNAGKHSKLGELIAKSVIKSIKESLVKQIWLTPTYQSNALIRLSRYDVDINEFYNDIPDKEEFLIELRKANRDSELVGYVSLILHVLDQYQNGLVTEKTAEKIIDSIFKNQISKPEWSSMKKLVNHIVKVYLNKK
ncbi:MAG: adenosylcobinamide amidohydrolase [Methanobrevibacter sp.]|uniref:adenosylcobinamide amidohydrolase n=1 Tax=Methanobrevibacter sp. TaxID=66852 RepID=UPI0026DF0F67|nr:adenosylcobinamide amidohydrolase [Methanobrevibacter sp.]MDO5848188.1 adenosylcobinamide amidohydrolase [Methanobrevibacter sp.]